MEFFLDEGDLRTLLLSERQIKAVIRMSQSCDTLEIPGIRIKYAWQIPGCKPCSLLTHIVNYFIRFPCFTHEEC